MYVAVAHQQNAFNSNNAIFDPKSYLIGDNLHYPFALLKKKAAAEGIFISTLDERPMDDYSAIICFDPPASSNILAHQLIRTKIPSILVLLESIAVRPENWEMRNHLAFDRVYTWNDDLVDNKKYFLLRLANKFPKTFPDVSARMQKAVMIASNKSSTYPGELYSKRLADIEWFSKNAPNYLDLFGHGWNERNFYGIFKVLNRISSFRKLFKTPPSIWSGKVESKLRTLENYRFSLAYENVKGIKGYITEKIFDSMAALCVPVYSGAGNIEDNVPKKCFIARDDFSCTKELYKYMAGMSDEEYCAYLDAIKGCFRNNSFEDFGSEKFSDVLISAIICMTKPTND
jgi:hypothetical protein